MAEPEQEGKVRHIGVSNFNVEQMERISSVAPVETTPRQRHLRRRELRDGSRLARVPPGRQAGRRVERYREPATREQGRRW
jgi:aryl-alcohol dehydrogenase-like predicted oxidoreductase